VGEKKKKKKKTIGDYLINIGSSEGMNPRKKVLGCAVDSCDRDRDKIT